MRVDRKDGFSFVTIRYDVHHFEVAGFQSWVASHLDGSVLRGCKVHVEVAHRQPEMSTQLHHDRELRHDRPLPGPTTNSSSTRAPDYPRFPQSSRFPSVKTSAMPGSSSVWKPQLPAQPTRASSMHDSMPRLGGEARGARLLEEASRLGVSEERQRKTVLRHQSEDTIRPTALKQDWQRDLSATWAPSSPTLVVPVPFESPHSWSATVHPAFNWCEGAAQPSALPMAASSSSTLLEAWPSTSAAARPSTPPAILRPEKATLRLEEEAEEMAALECDRTASVVHERMADSGEPLHQSCAGDGEDEAMTNAKLWEGAYAAGWRVHAKPDSHYIYVSATGDQFTNRRDAKSAAGIRSSATADVKVAAGIRSSAAAGTETYGPSTSRALVHEETVMCTHCAGQDNDDCLLLCDGFRCRAASHTFCCDPPLAAVPTGKWFCDGCALRQVGSRQQLMQTLQQSADGEKAPCRRLPLEERPRTAHPPGEAKRWVEADGVCCLRLATRAPTLEFDRAVQQGTIFNQEGVRIAGAVYEEGTGYAVAGTELHTHTDSRTLTSSWKLPARILTDANVNEDLQAPMLRPPEPGTEQAWRVYGAVQSEHGECGETAAQPMAADDDAALMCKVLYLPLDARLQRLSSAAVRSVASALDAGEYQADEKTGGGYLVAGNGCMATAPPPPMVSATQPDGSLKRHIIPYTRVGTNRPCIGEAVASAAPLMGSVAEAIGRFFPETTSGLAEAVRHHTVVGDAFMFPSHEEQREGLHEHDGDSGSICAHQLAMRLAGSLRQTANVCKRAHHQHCALHLDTDDGRRQHGSPLIYALLCEEGVLLDGEQPMPAGDFVVFECGHGGRCVRIQTACLHHVCVVILASDQHLHSNVFPDSLEVPSVPGIALLRLVPYARHGIDAFAAAVARQPELWEEARPQLDARLRMRAMQTLDSNPSYCTEPV
eukprot:CAMPEP_0115873706 /NCGR_PEP_ID=MMETSP0287-20121206/24138_1 /TAXON_ID=412157 /ORGANISM="Chrysochromulina rotalis, Strain UIO044" /LENGTH=940 /DNA_ID=CAMNT_0003328783 /DNA_START=355 /DNA_END=3178 /DNA_ORIENTATION=+